MAAIKKQQKDAILCNQASHANVLSPVGPRSYEGDNKQTKHWFCYLNLPVTLIWGSKIWLHDQKTTGP